MDSWQFLSDGPIGFHAIGGPDDLPTTHLFSPFSLAQQKHLQQGQSHSTADPISSSPSSSSPKPTASRAPPKPYTLIFAYCYQDEHEEITEQPHLLLGFKMRGFGAGHINGFGGKPLKMASLNEAATEPVSESPQDCVVRELEEETGISGKQVRDRLRWHGHLLIHAQDKESTSKFANEHALLSVFSARLPKATLETAERTDEMHPFLCPLAQVPLAYMHPESALLLSMVFASSRQTDADRSRLNSLAEPIITRFRAEINFDGSSTVHLPPAPHSLVLPQLDFPTIARQRLIKRWSLSLTLSNATKIQ